ncbi:MAG: hypothetical protein ACP5H2_07415 [Solirubrobacteraceae bacterium]
MTEQHDDFELLEFEQVEATPGTALLRLAARRPSGADVGPCLLVVSDGPVQHRHKQLPALPAASGLIRAAFSAPLAHVAPGATYALELPDGGSVRLPAPARRRSALAPLQADQPDEAADRSQEALDEARIVEAERRAESRRLAIAELEKRLRHERERRAAAEADLGHLRAERDAARAERDNAAAERSAALADRDRAEARARAAAAATGALEAQLQAAADAVNDGRVALEVQLADRDAELERLRAMIEITQGRAQSSRRDAAELEEQIARLRAQHATLEQALEDRDAERARAVAALQDVVAAGRAELSKAQNQVIELEDQLETLRQDRARRDAQHAYDLQTAQVRLDVARAEFEAARSDGETLNRRVASLESTLAELDAALAQRAAEIDVLRSALTQRGDPATVSDTQASVASSVELERLLADVRAAAAADASSTLGAEIDLLRAELEDHTQQIGRLQSELADADQRASAAEVELVTRTGELEAFGDSMRAQIRDLQRSREELITAATLSRAELDSERRRADAAEAELERIRQETSRAEAERKRASAAYAQVQATVAEHGRQVDELARSLASAEQTLREAHDMISVHEARNGELAAALRAETHRRVAVEEELVAATANGQLLRETLVYEASRNRPSAE